MALDFQQVRLSLFNAYSQYSYSVCKHSTGPVFYYFQETARYNEIIPAPFVNLPNGWVSTGAGVVWGFKMLLH